MKKSKRLSLCHYVAVSGILVVSCLSSRRHYNKLKVGIPTTLMFIIIAAGLVVSQIGCSTTSTATTTTSTCGTTSTTITNTTTTTTTSTTETTTTTNTTTTTSSYNSATLTHWGFDFATGLTTNEPGQYDGETITWNPDGVTTTVEGTTYPSYDGYIWWRGAMPLDAIPHQKHIGTGELSAVTTVPSTWDSGTIIWPLLANHVYVVMCTPEGYAKFKVISASTETNWPAEVQYYFTTEAVFHH